MPTTISVIADKSIFQTHPIGDPLKLKHLALAAATAASLLLAPAAHADNKAIAVDEMEAYLEFVEYGGGVIFAEQIPADEWKKMIVIDARDAGQFAKGHIPGAINMDWRQVLAKRHTIPKDKPVLIYCNTGSLSAQAGFAMRVAGWENLRILQGGMEEWNAKGGFDAAAKATAPAKH
jgi:rhodanese-related sulfurtransferase